MSNERGGAVTGDAEQGLGLVPKLRFPEFSDYPLFETRLGQVTEEGTARNRGQFTADVIMGVSKEDGMVPMQAHVIADDISRYKVVRKDWFAYNPMRLNIGSIARWHGEEDALVSPDYVVFHCPKHQKEPSLLAAYFDHFRRSMQWDTFTNEAGDGGVRVRIYYRDIAQVRLSLPDRNEQKKIADCLSSLDDVIAAEEDRLAGLKARKKGLMQQLFPAEGQTTPRLRFPEFRGAGDWEEKQFGELIHTVTPPKKLQTSEYALSGTFPVIDQSQHMIAGWTDDSEAVIADNLPLIVFGDHTCVIKIASEPFAQGADGIKIIAPNGETTVEFLYQSLANEPLQMEDYKRHFSKLKERRVCFPDRRTGEQQRIADCLSTLDAQATATRDYISALNVHKAALMQQLFPSPRPASA